LGSCGLLRTRRYYSLELLDEPLGCGAAPGLDDKLAQLLLVHLGQIDLYPAEAPDICGDAEDPGCLSDQGRLLLLGGLDGHRAAAAHAAGEHLVVDAQRGVAPLLHHHLFGAGQGFDPLEDRFVLDPHSHFTDGVTKGGLVTVMPALRPRTSTST